MQEHSYSSAIGSDPAGTEMDTHAGGPWPQGVRAIRRPRPNELTTALQPLWDKTPDRGQRNAQRFIEYSRTNGLSLDQCWTCEQEETGWLRPTCLAIPNAGRTALIFCSDLAEKRYSEVLTALLRTVAENVDARRIRILQVLLTRQEKRAQDLFAAAGFDHLAELSYMERRIRSGPNRSGRRKANSNDREHGRITFEPYRDEMVDDFKEALRSSYVETRDCPKLCGLRTLEDILRGHRATGVFDPDVWTLARYDGRPAAVLLLSPFPDQQTIELTYLGVAKAFRCKGLGRLLVERALEQAGQKNANQISLAVDEANLPALQLYQRAGFQRVDRRTAMILAVGGAR